LIRATDGFAGVFNAVDWGYLILLYVMLHLIRFILLAAFYPLISKIGIGTNPKEAAVSVDGAFSSIVA
jgi:nucleoside recognition membrane protein YjiH